MILADGLCVLKASLLYLRGAIATRKTLGFCSDPGTIDLFHYGGVYR
jgi:hypothetical protein